MSNNQPPKPMKSVEVYRIVSSAMQSQSLGYWPSKKVVESTLPPQFKYVPPAIEAYEEGYRAISKMRADGVISASAYEVLWSGLTRERAADLRYQEELKKYLPVKPKSSS